LLTSISNGKNDNRAAPTTMADALAGDWKHLGDDHPLNRFATELGAILADTGHNEMYGVVLQAPEEGYVCFRVGDDEKSNLKPCDTDEWWLKSASGSHNTHHPPKVPPREYERPGESQGAARERAEVAQRVQAA